MKKIAFLLALSVSLGGFAAEKADKKGPRKPASEEIKCSENPNEGIGIDPAYVEKQIAAAGSCRQAVNIAESCAAGSSMDTGIAGTAAELCDKKAGKLSKGDVNLKKLMLARCAKVCDPRNDGTLCLSQQAFCRLSVSEFIHSVSFESN